MRVILFLLDDDQPVCRRRPARPRARAAFRPRTRNFWIFASFFLEMFFFVLFFRLYCSVSNSLDIVCVALLSHCWSRALVRNQQRRIAWRALCRRFVISAFGVRRVLDSFHSSHSQVYSKFYSLLSRVRLIIFFYISLFPPSKTKQKLILFVLKWCHWKTRPTLKRVTTRPMSTQNFSDRTIKPQSQLHFCKKLITQHACFFVVNCRMTSWRAWRAAILIHVKCKHHLLAGIMQ